MDLSGSGSSIARQSGSVERLTPAEKYVAELPTMKLAA